MRTLAIVHDKSRPTWLMHRNSSKLRNRCIVTLSDSWHFWSILKLDGDAAFIIHMQMRTNSLRMRSWSGVFPPHPAAISYVVTRTWAFSRKVLNHFPCSKKKTLNHHWTKQSQIFVPTLGSIEPRLPAPARQCLKTQRLPLTLSPNAKTGFHMWMKQQI